MELVNIYGERTFQGFLHFILDLGLQMINENLSLEAFACGRILQLHKEGLIRAIAILVVEETLKQFDSVGFRVHFKELIHPYLKLFFENF